MQMEDSTISFGLFLDSALTSFSFLLEIMATSYNSITGEVTDQATTELQTENRFGSDLKKKIYGR